jgi:hypothetical protein
MQPETKKSSSKEEKQASEKVVKSSKSARWSNESDQSIAHPKQIQGKKVSSFLVLLGWCSRF